MKIRWKLCVFALIIIFATVLFFQGGAWPVSGNEFHESESKIKRLSLISRLYQEKAGSALLDFSHVPEFASLHLDGEDKATLLRIAAAEAGTQGIKGKALVMRVVLNRVGSPEFPNSVSEVVFQVQNGIYQFCPVRNGSYWTVEITDECFEALNMVLSGWDESSGALYFCVPESAWKWHEDNLEFLFQYGNHKFYIEKGEGETKERR